MLKIVMNHESKGIGPQHSRGNKIALRGLYYYSPFIRDFQNSKELLNIFNAYFNVVWDFDEMLRST